MKRENLYKLLNPMTEKTLRLQNFDYSSTFLNFFKSLMNIILCHFKNLTCFMMKDRCLFFWAKNRCSWKMSWSIIALFFIFLSNINGQTTETLQSGAFIVNMGMPSQTINNGLKPYGLVYDLIKNYRVPVKWVINPLKTKDGVDFTYNGADYKGGPFIIPAEYRTAAVNARIVYWQLQGVVGLTAPSAITVPVYTTIKAAPVWTLDAKNGSIAEQYLINAGIPSTAYNWLEPADLGGCNDLFIMPHADPTWATHSNLLNWNQINKGGIWAACHAVSVLESLSNPGNPSQKMNFLSNPSLVNYSNHANPSIPFTYNFSTDPYMQFIGIADNAFNNGSEQVFLPALGGGWRSSTKTAIVDPTQSDVPTKSPGAAAIVAYGKAFSDNSRGSVMYQAGHDHNKTSSPGEKVAAQRIMLNFSFATANERAVVPTITGNDTINAGTPTAYSLTVPSGYSISNYSVAWQSSCGGTFSPNATQANITFTPPPVTTTTPCSITAVITDACGRVFFENRIITILCDFNISPTTAACAAYNNATIDLNTSGTAPSPYSYSWTRNSITGSGIGTSITALSEGGYNVTVTASNGCMKTTSTMVNVTTQPSLSLSSYESSCTANDDKVLSGESVNLSADGTANSYFWDNSLGTGSTKTANPVISTTYTVSATSASGCTATASKAITVINSSSASISATESSCTSNDDKILGGANVNLIASGGSTYSWSNSLGSGASKSVTPSATTLYTVTATDVNGCTAIANKVISIVASPNANISASESSCTADDDKVVGGDAVTLTANGGLTYAWNNSLGAGSSKTVTPSVSTIYTVTATDASGCTSIANKIITVITNPTISIAASESSCTTNDDKIISGTSVALAVSGGATYTWDNGLGAGSSKTVTPSVLTTYSVTATDVNGCTGTANKTISIVSSSIASISAIESSCSPNDDKIINGATVTLTAGGGATYAWNNSLGAGSTKTPAPSVTTTYSVTATDVNGCTATASKLITVASALSLSTSATNILCNGASTGAINLTVSGGSSPYTYNWSDGNTTEDRTGLAGGTYAVTVTDASGCSQTTSITLTQPTAISLTTTPTNINCNGASTGAITVSVSGGASPYTYNWGGGVTTQNRTGLLAGTYNLTVTDANSCTQTATMTLTQPAAALSLSTSITHIVCGVGTGAINLTVSGGTTPYTYNWGGGVTTEDRTNLAAGNYSVTVTDTNGCAATASPTVTQSTPATLTTSVTNITCFGGTGAINLTATGGSPFTYNWGGGVTTEDRTGLATGTYTVTVTNAQGCTSTTSATVTTPSVLALSATATNINCIGGSTGAINLTPTGGTSPYTYNWGGGVTTEDRTGLAAGIYTVTVTDANGCTATLSRTITQPTALNLSTLITQVTCVGGTDGAIDLTVTGSTAPYTYNWGSGITTQDRTGLGAGTYTVIVTDANGCTATTGATLTAQNGAPNPPTNLRH